jgi:hypothetical protein
VEVGRFEEAITAHQDEAAICRETGDEYGEGRALNNIETVRWSPCRPFPAGRS